MHRTKPENAAAMAKTNAKNAKDAKGRERDRRAVVEQLRRDQQRAERRRTIVVISACVAVALVIVALAAIPLLRQKKAESGALTTIGSSESAAGCQKLVKKDANGQQQHKSEGTVINYPDSPPAFGPHYPTPAPFAPRSSVAGTSAGKRHNTTKSPFQTLDSESRASS